MNPPKKNKKGNVRKEDCIPSITLDGPFGFIFGQEKFLKSLLNGLYNYDKECFIEKLTFSPNQMKGPGRFCEFAGTLIPDIKCSCTTNLPENDRPIHFVVEMQRKGQKSYIDRALLVGGRVVDTEFIRNVNNSNKALLSKSHDAKFEEGIVNIVHLSILRDTIAPRLGWRFNVIPFFSYGEFKRGSLVKSSVELASDPGKSIATEKRVYTFIQLKEYLKKKDNIKNGSDFKFKNWLDFMALDIWLKHSDEREKIKLYEVQKTDDPIIKETIDFMKSELWNDETAFKVMVKQAAEESEKAEQIERYQKLQTEIKEKDARIQEIEREKEKMKMKLSAQAQKMQESGESEEYAKDLLDLIEEDIEESVENEDF